jgi:hypothetical protein
MNSHYDIQYSDRGKLIYFDVDMKELFNVTLSTPGVISALNYAFRISKSAVPVQTGLMLRSYTMTNISSTTVRCFFDPDKILGKKRLGRIVKEYYPQYLVETPKRFDWLQILIKRFYDALKLQMELLSKKNKEIDMTGFYLLLLLLLEDHNRRKKEEMKRRKRLEEEKKKLQEKRDAFIKSLKGGK